MTDPGHAPMTEDRARALGERAVRHWTEKGALGVGFDVHQGPAGWTYRLTGMGTNGLPVNWREGAKRGG